MRYFRTFFDCLEKALNFTIAMLCLTLLAALFIQVLNRYLFGISWPILQFVVPFCFLWMCLLGSAVAIRKNLHFEVDLLSKMLSPGVQRFHRSLITLSVIAGGLMIAWTALGFVGLGMLKKNPATGIRMIYIYVSLLVGGGLISLMAFEKLLLPQSPEGTQTEDDHVS